MQDVLTRRCWHAVGHRRHFVLGENLLACTNGCGILSICCARARRSNWFGGMSELAEGARLEIVYTPKAYPGFKSPSLRHFNQFDFTSRRGGRAVECGGLENRFTGEPGNQGSNPCLSAMRVHAPTRGVFHFWKQVQKRRCDKSQRLTASFVERLTSCQRSFPHWRTLR